MVDDPLQNLPEPARSAATQAWKALSDTQRRELLDATRLLPGTWRPLKDVLGMVFESWLPLTGTKSTIAIVGPTNVGKSTLYNQLVRRKDDRAEVSPVPGTTRDNQEADAGLFRVVDTPGADAAGEVGEREQALAFAAAQEADFLVILFEATRGIRRAEQELFHDLAALGKPYVVVMNKMDLVPRDDRTQVIESAARNLGLEASQIIDTVATQGTNVERIVLAIAQTEPQLLAIIGQALPEYRSKLAWQRTVPAAGAAAAVALMPLPFLDLFPLLGIQTGLVLSIARIHGYEITLARAKELLAAFGIGMLGRTLFRELSKLGGVPGWILSSAIAAATTVVIGQAADRWFSRGERLSPQEMSVMTRNVTVYLRDQLRDLAKKKPDQGTLSERITGALQNLPVASRIAPASSATPPSTPAEPA